MPRFRSAAIVFALAALVSQRANAQQGRRFENAWYWGVRGGQVVYSTPGNVGNELQGYGPWSYLNTADQNKLAPTVGIDWLITRTRGGAYLGYSQGIFSKDLALSRPNFGGDSTYAVAHIGGLRRFDIAGMMFPMVEHYAQPYLGLGVAILQVGDLQPSLRYNSAGGAPAGSAEQMDTLSAQLLDRKAAVSPLLILGFQARLKPFSLFVQGSGISLPDQFILQRKNRYAISYEVGIRYNVGSAIEKF